MNLIRMQNLSPTLIAYRVSAGNAWTRNTTQQTIVRPSIATAETGNCTILGGNSEDIILKSRDGSPKPGNIHPKDYEAGEVQSTSLTWT